MNKAIALATNEIAFVAWTYDSRIANCLGFSLRRKDVQTGVTTVLPAWVGFQGDSNPDWKPKTTDDWPVQKFNWRDLTAKPGAAYQYQVVPMIGTPGNLNPALDQALTTDPVLLTPRRGPFLAYFNQGILSTQSVAHMLPSDASGPSSGALLEHIGTPGDALRLQLAGQMIDALETLLNRAKVEGGSCYAALYELADPELLDRLLATPSLHLVLSNTGPDDATDKDARAALHQAGIDVTDRMLGSGHIGHNKFMVYVDASDQPQAVLTGSTNWTSTAICAQSNNALICEDPNVAAAYLEYWKRLKEDTDAGARQAAGYRTANDAVVDLASVGGRLWFSPNTTQQRKPSSNPAQPSDLADVFEVIKGAKQAILFLLFQPGAPSVIDAITEAANANPNLLIHGAATDPKAVDAFDTQLFHRSTTPEVVTMVAATAIKDDFAYWQKELLKSSPSAHAIIHDKIVVVDPFGDCAVVTGSHNLGFTASYANDENLLIVRGNAALAEAYTTHVMDVYDHYRWRYWLASQQNKAWTGLQDADTWQDKYFTGAAAIEVAFWTRQTEVAPVG
jgi:hypothetical protein